ncbi:UNKNOWN [Stylonychia lemnae]|uniref:ENTH domain-containing protein n=1 Tax=Stylonychia lemnae TaxID=5949 RepID=A0A078AN03_STYLE|nr:UNKNOWN [Stylonychia lemnae]|eukprot:CDW83750.1 UNKNOWN [Stylonychia lemnae]
MKETVTSYTSKSDIEKILIEATGNENWNIANSKLQMLADAAHQHDNYQRIMDHLKGKLECPAFEWRRVLKVSKQKCLISMQSLVALEYILKHGPARVQQDLRNEMFRLNKLQQFTHFEDGSDKGNSIRQKAHLIADLVTIQTKYDEERELARQYREKFYSKPGGISSDSMSSMNGSHGSNGNYNSMGSQGYGGYAPKQEEAGALSYVKNIGGMVSGAGSYVSSGLTYLGIKKDNSQTPNKYGSTTGGSSMMGYGSESVAKTGGYYDPPGGYQAQDNVNKGAYDHKWGAQPTQQTQQEEKIKPVWGQQNKQEELKPKDTKKEEPVSKDEKEKKKKDKKTHKKKRKRSSSGSDSSDNDKNKKQKGDKKQSSNADINLLDLDFKPEQNQKKSDTNTFFDFPPAPTTNTTSSKANTADLMDLLSFDTPVSQTQQPPIQNQNIGGGIDLLSFNQSTNQTFPTQQTTNNAIPTFNNFPINTNIPVVSNNNLMSGSNVQNFNFNFNQAQNNLNINQTNIQAFPGLGIQNHTTSQTNIQHTQNLFNNLNLSNGAQAQVQQNHNIQKQQSAPQSANKNSNDAWDLGANLINLNLKQGMSVGDFDQEVKKPNTFANQNPVYINQGANKDQQSTPKFIPNLGFGMQGQQQQYAQMAGNQQYSQQQMPGYMNSQQIPGQNMGAFPQQNSNLNQINQQAQFKSMNQNPSLQQQQQKFF